MPAWLYMNGRAAAQDVTAARLIVRMHADGPVGGKLLSGAALAKLFGNGYEICSSSCRFVPQARSRFKTRAAQEECCQCLPPLIVSSSVWA